MYACSSYGLCRAILTCMLVVSAGGGNRLRYRLVFCLHVQCRCLFSRFSSLLPLSLSSVELLGDECEGILLYTCNGWFFVWISNVDCYHHLLLVSKQKSCTQNHPFLLSLPCWAGALCNRHNALRVTCTSGSTCRDLGWELRTTLRGNSHVKWCTHSIICTLLSMAPLLWYLSSQDI